MAIMGERSSHAQPTPVARLVAPGPSVAMQKPGRAGHAPGHVGGESGRALVGGEHEIDAALAHRLHQRKHIAARNPEAAGDARRLQRCDDQIGIVHGNGISTITGQQQVTAGILMWHAHLLCRRAGTTAGQILLTQ